MRALGDSGLAMILVFAAILSWSGANICWIMADKSQGEQSDWSRTLSIVGAIILLLTLAGILSGPDVLVPSLAILCGTPVLWLISYLIAERHKTFWEKKLRALKKMLPKKKDGS